MIDIMTKGPLSAYTYVKSWRMTLAGLKGISRSFSELSTQFKIVSMSDAKEEKLGYLLTHVM